MSDALRRDMRHFGDFTVAVTKGCPDCTAARMAKAPGSGIEEDIIREVINLAAGINSGFVITAVARGSQKK